MEKKVLTPEEIQSILKLQKIQAKLVEDFGLVEYQIQSLTQQKYGDGTIDLEKGEFISST